MSGHLAQIGEELRVPVSYQEFPDLVRHAVLAAEDGRVFEHGGLAWMGVLRAVVRDVMHFMGEALPPRLAGTQAPSFSRPLDS